MKEGSDLEELVEQFTSQTVSVRVTAYRTLIQKCTSDGSAFKFNWSEYSSEDDSKKAVANLKADLSNESDDISYEAAGGCGCLLANGSFLSMLKDTDQREMLDHLIKIIKERKGKKVVVRTLWCIARSKLDSSIYRERASVLLEVICDVLKTETSASSALEALQVIHTLVEVIPEIVTKDIRTWFPIYFRYMLHEASRVRNVVFITLHSLKLFVDSGSDKLEIKNSIITCLVADLQSKTCKKMIELVSKDSADLLKGWRLIVQILGPILHKGTSLINDLLEVVEKGFKSSTPEIRTEAFRCWRSLIDNFALDPEVLLHHKRLKLLLAPLKANNAKIEELAHEKLLVWWHLIFRLKKHNIAHFESVLVPFLKFCFGGMSPSSSGCQNIGLAQRNLMMSAATSPGRRFPGLYMLCAEVLAQVLSVGIEIPERQHFIFSLSPVEEPVVNDALFARTYQLLFAFASEALISLSDESDSKRRNRQHALGILIVQSIVGRMKCLMKSETNKKESVDQVKEMFMLFSELQHRCKKGDLLSEFVFTFYNLIISSSHLALPLSVINSRQYNISTGNTVRDMMSGTLSNHIIHQLCKPSMLQIAVNSEEYFTVLITILENSKPSTGKLGFLQSVLKELEGAEGFFNTDHSETLRRFWAILVRQLLLHIEETQIIDQGDGLENDWSCVYSMLMFPINQSMASFKDANEAFNQQIMADWSELWSKFTELTPLAATAEPNSEMEYIARGTLGVYKRTIANSTSDSYGGAYNLMANILLQITQKMRYSELGKVSLKQVNSPAKPKKKAQPLHNLSGTVELFETLFLGLMRMGACSGRINTAQLLCESIITIFKGIRQEKFINPLITGVIGPISEGLKISPFIRFNVDVGKSFVKVLRTFSLMFEEQVGSAHTADHINKLELLFRLTLSSTTKEIKQAGRQLWKSSFASTKHSIPSSLYEVLKENSLPPASLNDSQDDVDEYQVNPKENVPDNVMPGSFLKRSGGVDSLKFESPRSKLDSPRVNKIESPRSKLDSSRANRLSLGTPKSMEKKIVNLHDMREEDFVKVVSPKPSRKVLTEHQIEKLKEKKDIPALYADLSQSASQIIPAQFASQHSFEDSVCDISETRKINVTDNEKTSEKQLNFAGIFPPEKEKKLLEKPVEKLASPAVRRRSGRMSASKGLQAEEKEAVKSSSSKNDVLKSKETETPSVTESISTPKTQLETKGKRSNTPRSQVQSGVKTRRTRRGGPTVLEKQTDDDMDIGSADKDLSSAENNSEPLLESVDDSSKVTKESVKKNDKCADILSSSVKKIVETRSSPDKTTDDAGDKPVKKSGSDEPIEENTLTPVSMEDSSKPVEENTSTSRSTKDSSKPFEENTSTSGSTKDSSKPVEENTSTSGSTKDSSKPVEENTSTPGSIEESSKPVEEYALTPGSTRDSRKVANSTAGMKIVTPVRTYPGKKKGSSSGESDYTDEDLDQELHKTSLMLQDSLKNCIVEPLEDSQVLCESNRRKSLTPSKKTIDDVRKTLKGKGSMAKSPSETKVLKEKLPINKSKSDPLMNISSSNKEISFSEMEVTSSAVKDAKKVPDTLDANMNNEPDVSETESEEAVPSSQENDGPLAQMAEILANSRHRVESLLHRSQTIEDSKDLTEEKLLNRKGKRKRSLNDDLEDDVKQKNKKKKEDEIESIEILDNELEQSAEESVVGESAAITPQTKVESTKKPGRSKRSSQSSLDSQNSCDLFDSLSQAITPPKITRSGRKIVAPRKDMPEAMTPPGGSSKKRKDAIEPVTPPGIGIGKKKKASDSEEPECTVSPSLLSSAQFLNDSSDEKKRSLKENLPSPEKKVCPAVIAVGNDVPQVVELDTTIKRNVQKKITDMFAKGKKSQVGEEKVSEMDPVEDTVAKEHEIADGMYPSTPEKSSTCCVESNETVSEASFNKQGPEEFLDELPNLKKNNLQEVEHCTSPGKNTKLNSSREKEESDGNSKSPARNVDVRSPLKKRVTAVRKLEESSKGKSDSVSSSDSTKSVEIVTCIPESLDANEINLSMENNSSPPKTGKVLSPKKKWVQEVQESEIAALENGESPQKLQSSKSKKVECESTYGNLSKQVSPKKGVCFDVAKKDVNKTGENKASLSITCDEVSKNNKSVESDDDDNSDVEVDIEMVDPEESVTKSVAVTPVNSVQQENPNIIDISSSSSPISSEKSREFSVKKPEGTSVDIGEPENIIVLSSGSKSDSSDDMAKNGSKSSDSSSFENAQRVDEELKEVEKSSRSPKKDKNDRQSSISVLDEKMSEEELSPEKTSGSKFNQTIGTPERKKKFGSVKYAGSRAAMLVACAKQNIKNRTTEGDSPSKSILGDGVSPAQKNTSSSGSTCETPPSRKRKLNESLSENGKPWAKHEPSPGATPSPSILKKSGLEDSLGKDTSTSPPNKQRRVSFADPPVSERVEIPPSPKSLKGNRAQKRLDMTKADSPVKRPVIIPNEENSQPDPDSPVDVNCSQPIYPPLVDCQDRVDCVALQLTSPFLFEGLKMILEERGIRTVGDMCQLTEADIRQLPVREPKVVGTLNVLRKYEESKVSGKKQTDVMIDDVEAQLSEIFGKDGEIRLDNYTPSSPKQDATEIPATTVLQPVCESRDNLPVEDGIAPLEPRAENVSCETINGFCKELYENPQLLNVLAENLNDELREKLLQEIMVKMPYGAVLQVFFEFLRKRESTNKN